MGIRDLFLSLLGSSKGRPVEDAERLAVLVLTEIEMFGGEGVEDMRRTGMVGAQLATEIERGYDIYLARVDDEPNLRTLFAREAARRLAGGDEGILAGLFQRLDARPRPPVEPA